MTQRTWWQRVWPYLAAAVGGAVLAWAVIAIFVFPPGAPPANGTVPNVIGLSFDVAGQRLRQAGFKVARGEMRFQSAAPKMSVLQMTPDQGTREPLGTTVTLDLSAGPRTSTVPDVAGMPLDAADSVMGDAGFTIAPDTDRVASDQPVGALIGTRPPAGSAAPVPSAVILQLSAGPATITVPDLAGRSIIEARVLLAQLGLVLGDVTILRGGSGGDTATVVEQAPAAGTLAPAGARITVSVSGGPTP